MPSKVFYPTSTPHFAVPDGQVLPTVGIGVGTKAFKYPSGETYFWTGAEWIRFEPSLANIEAILEGMAKQLSRLLEIMEQINSEEKEGG